MSLNNLIVFMLLLMSIGCKEDEDVKTSIYHAEGIFYYRADINKFTIVVSIDGTYDSQYIYVSTSDIPGINDGQKVLFSGDISPYNEDIAYFVGQEYYHIHLTDIKVLE